MFFLCIGLILVRIIGVWMLFIIVSKLGVWENCLMLYIFRVGLLWWFFVIIFIWWFRILLVVFILLMVSLIFFVIVMLFLIVIVERLVLILIIRGFVEFNVLFVVKIEKM